MVSWQARGLTRQEVILPPKVWSRQAWLQPMQVLISSATSPRSSFAHKLGVGQEGARHAHHVGHAVGQHLLGHLGRVDAVGGHQRNAHLAFELLRHPGKGRARHLGGNGGNARLVPANAGVEDGDARFFQCLRQLHHFFLRRAAFDQVEHGQAEDDDEVGAHPGAGAAHDLQREADAVFILPPHASSRWLVCAAMNSLIR
jgi:hypothetical protein